MRNASINVNSPKEDVWGVLTGIWNEYDDREWHVVKTPFMVAMTATLDAGPGMLPVTPPRTSLLSWANAEHSGSIVVKAKDRNFTLPEKSVVQVIMFGTIGDNNGK
jgi:hypothetical protein